jgi:hypothetical protein
MQIEAEMLEARLAIDCLHYYYLFVCETKEDVSTLPETLCRLPLESLKMVIFLLMNDAFINLIPDEEELAASQINDHRDIIFYPEVGPPRCVEMIFVMLAARNFALPAEMLSVSIDAKLYSLYNAIDDRKLTLQDLLQLGAEDIGISDGSEDMDDRPDRKRLMEQTVQRLLQLRQQFIADRKSNEKFHDKARIGYFLQSLSSPPDPSLGMNSTERLIGAIRLSIQHNELVDLRSCDLRSVDMPAVSFEKAKVLMTRDQVRSYQFDLHQPLLRLFE